MPFWNDLDLTGDFAVIRKGLKIYRVEVKKGSTKTLLPPPTPQKLKPIVSKLRAQTIVTGEDPNCQHLLSEFTGLEKKVYEKYLNLKQLNPIPGSRDFRRLEKLKKAVYRETQKIVREKRRGTFELTQQMGSEERGYEPFSSSEEEDSEEEEERRTRELENPTWSQRHRNHPQIFKATAANMTLQTLDTSKLPLTVTDSQSEDEDQHSIDGSTYYGGDTSPGGSTIFPPHMSPTVSPTMSPTMNNTPLPLVLDNLDGTSASAGAQSHFASGYYEEDSDDDTVYSRESAKYPRITRQILDLFGGKEEAKEARYIKLMEKKRLDGLKPKTLYERMQLEKEEKEASEKKKEMEKKKKTKRNKVSAFDQARRGSVIMKQASGSKSGQEAYKQQLYARIATCSHCKTKLRFCGGCQKYVTRFLENNQDLARQYNRRKEAIFRHIKKKLDSKDFVVGVGDELEGSILDVLKYLSAEEKERVERMKEKGVAFRRRGREFEEELGGEIYEEVDLFEHTDGVNMFSDPDIVDPFFEKNVITEWVERGISKELYIPKEMQNPWTKNGGEKRMEIERMPKKRQAGQTIFSGEGVSDYEEIFV
ncbi:hypothetical protein TL16_g11127 [Triparma laevis f. inornata]|uniref:Uncharacterized protein n=1 Tax=Triparma laevis f. inornata TaxID=1714386 RepID=A0A9W7BLE4_9STRA|nr:hypothetical protein TL16_g11127 [Triparma laevis f. inornata]